MSDPNTWPNHVHTANAEIMAQPRDWNVACAMAQVRMGVPLTEAQRVLVEKSIAARSQ